MSRKELKLLSQALMLIIPLLINRVLSTETLDRNVTATLCPYTDFCHFKATEVFNRSDSDPCCNECSCGNDCWETQNCCPDKQNIVYGTTQLVCKSTMVKKRPQDDTTFQDGLSQGIKRYLIIDKCPDHEKLPYIQQICVDYNKTLLQDFIWVSDILTGKIYQNEHCARCNGVNQTVAWNIKTMCGEILRSSLQNMSDILLSEECNIITEAPEEGDRFEKYRCFIPTVSGCNETGLWQQYDKRVYEACQSKTVPFFQTLVAGVIIYKNIFCFLCNGMKAHAADKICPDRDWKPSRQTISGPFIALIDFRRRTTKEKSPFGCAGDEFFDKYMKKCRKLLCPFGSIQINGECKPVTVSTTNLCIEISFLLRIVWEDTSFSPDGQNVRFKQKEGKQIVSEFNKAFGQLNCIYLSRELRINKPTSEQRMTYFVMIVKDKTTVGCQLNDAYNAVARIVGQKVKVLLAKRGHMVLDVEKETRSFINMTHDTKDFYFTTKSGICFQKVRLQEPYCPQFELEYNEISNVTNSEERKLLTTLFNSSLDVIESTSAMVCLAEYEKIMEKAYISTRIGMKNSANIGGLFIKLSRLILVMILMHLRL